MSEILDAMAWGEPIVPVVRDAAWEAEVKAGIGMVPDLLLRVSPSPWLRTACLNWPRIPAEHIPQDLADIAALVTAQENACRYCYGVARSFLRIFGRSEKEIAKLERAMQFAELDEQQRIYIRFCRNLARSNPRPPKTERDKLVSMGFSETQIREVAFLVANYCFMNRVATFISTTPMYQIEKMADSLVGRIMRPLIRHQMKKTTWRDIPPLRGDAGSFPGVVKALTGSAGASVINDGLREAFQSEILSKELKILMFAVVARSLQCRFCQDESRRLAVQIGLSEQAFDHALTSLSHPGLQEDEAKILAWTRETIHYDSRAIQNLNRQLVREIDPVRLVDAIGIAALANAVVRLAVILEE